MSRRAASARSRHQPSGRDPMTLLPSTNTRCCTAWVMPSCCRPRVAEASRKRSGVRCRVRTRSYLAHRHGTPCWCEPQLAGRPPQPPRCSEYLDERMPNNGSRSPAACRSTGMKSTARPCRRNLRSRCVSATASARWAKVDRVTGGAAVCPGL